MQQNSLSANFTDLHEGRNDFFIVSSFSFMKYNIIKKSDFLNKVIVLIKMTFFSNEFFFFNLLNVFYYKFDYSEFSL